MIEVTDRLDKQCSEIGSDDAICPTEQLHSGRTPAPKKYSFENDVLAAVKTVEPQIGCVSPTGPKPSRQSTKRTFPRGRRPKRCSGAANSSVSGASTDRLGSDIAESSFGKPFQRRATPASIAGAGATARTLVLLKYCQRLDKGADEE